MKDYLCSYKYELNDNKLVRIDTLTGLLPDYGRVKKLQPINKLFMQAGV